MTWRKSPQTLLVLTEFLQSPQDWKYGYYISRSTDLKSGTLYPILMRLAERGMLETSWETAEMGRPPRHLYKLTQDGLRAAREIVSSRAEGAVGVPVLSGVKTNDSHSTVGFEDIERRASFRIARIEGLGEGYGLRAGAYRERLGGAAVGAGEHEGSIKASRG